ncbi:hypothetical protein [Nonomuraea fuscirosea]|uniref:hypothetical protein n=1 Tax=Nonomuraea fuscirosea TaxID=1291556 RepID=UPI0034025F9A
MVGPYSRISEYIEGAGFQINCFRPIVGSAALPDHRFLETGGSTFMPEFEWTKAKIDSEAEVLASATQAAKELQAHCNEHGWKESIANAANDYHESLQAPQAKLSYLRGLVEEQETEESRAALSYTVLVQIRDGVGRMAAAQEEHAKRIATIHEKIAEHQRIAHEQIAISAEAAQQESARLFQNLTDLTRGSTTAPEPEAHATPTVEEPPQPPPSETEEPPEEPSSFSKS